MSIFIDDKKSLDELINLHKGMMYDVNLEKVNGDKITFMKYKKDLNDSNKGIDHNFQPNVEYETYRVSYDGKFEKLKNFTGTPDIVGRINKRGNKSSAISTTLVEKPTTSKVDSKVVINIISGPMDMSYHKNVFGKNIYLISDFIHGVKEGECYACTPENNCQLLYNWLDDRFRNAQVKTDFFIEYDIVTKDIVKPAFTVKDIPNPTDIFIYQMRDYFNKCLVADKTECLKKYPNTRIHYADARSIIYIDDYYDETFVSNTIIMNIHDEAGQDFWDGLNTGNFNNFLNIINIINDGEWIKNLMLNLPTADELEDLLPNFGKYQKFIDSLDVLESGGQNRIRKNLSKVDQNIRDKILDFYKGKLTFYFKNIDAMIDQFLKIKNIINTKNNNRDILRNMFLNDSKTSINRKAQRLFLTLVEVAAMQMDIYLLARMFKKSLSDGNDVYVFAGHGHIHHYREFIIKTLKKTNFSISTKVENRCIDISSINNDITTSFASIEILDIETGIREFRYLSKGEIYEYELNDGQIVEFTNRNGDTIEWNNKNNNKNNNIIRIYDSDPNKQLYRFSGDADINFAVPMF